MGLTVFKCKYKEKKDSEWEEGFAVVRSIGSQTVYVILPHFLTTEHDIPVEVYDYQILKEDGFLSLT